MTDLVIVFPLYKRFENLIGNLEYIRRWISCSSCRSTKIHVVVHFDGVSEIFEEIRNETIELVVNRSSAFLEISVIKQDINLGLKGSIDYIFKNVIIDHDAYLVVEDDIRLHQGSLDYFVTSLDLLRNDRQLKMISLLHILFIRQMTLFIRTKHKESVRGDMVGYMIKNCLVVILT